MRNPFSFAVCIALLVGSAIAHDDAYLDAQKAPNGGQLRMAGGNHFELVVDRAPEIKEKPILVYLSDHAGQKISAVGATGTVTLLSGGARSTTSLFPDGDNRMRGKGTYASMPDLQATVSIRPSGQSAVEARFSPLGKAPVPHGAHTQ